MKRTIEIDDTLDETVNGAISDLKDYVNEIINDNPEMETEELVEYIRNEIGDRISEISDSATPIYTSEIEDLWYLYKNEFEEAYKNAGIGDNPLENNGMTAIYLYIEQELYDWLRNELEDYVSEVKPETE